MGRKKRTVPPFPGTVAPLPTNINASAPLNKKQRQNEESYLVKKYWPSTNHRSIDSFCKYTKSHRMLDAAYVRRLNGATPDKPHVFSTRVGGVDLGWGRGKTRDGAIDGKFQYLTRFRQHVINRCGYFPDVSAPSRLLRLGFKWWWQRWMG